MEISTGLLIIILSIGDKKTLKIGEEKVKTIEKEKLCVIVRTNKLKRKQKYCLGLQEKIIK